MGYSARVIENHLKDELQFMATETILMEAVKSGGDRQKLHEKIRKYSMEESVSIKRFGKKNNLLQKILSDRDLNLSDSQIEKVKNIKNYIGRAPEQTKEYITNIISPLLKENNIKDDILANNQINI